MSRKLSEQDLYALFGELDTDDMPSGMASRIEQQVLTEVNRTLQPGGVALTRGSGWFASLFSNINMPSLQLLPSFAMGAVAAAVVLALWINPGLLNRLTGVEMQTGQQPGSTSEVDPVLPTPTEVPVETATATPTPLAEDEAAVPLPSAEVTPTEMPQAEVANEDLNADDSDDVASVENQPEAPVEDVAPEPNELQSEDNSVPIEPEENEVDQPQPSEDAEAPVDSEPATGVSAGTETQFGPSGGNNNADESESDNAVEPSKTPTSIPTATVKPTDSRVVQKPTATAVTTGVNKTATPDRVTQTVKTATPTTITEPTATNTSSISSPTRATSTRSSTPTRTPTAIATSSGTITGGTATPSPTPSLTPTKVPPTRTPTRTPTSAPSATDDSEQNGGIEQSVPTRTPTRTNTPTQATIRPVDTDTPQPTLTATGTSTSAPTGTLTPRPPANRPPEVPSSTVDLFEDGEITIDLRDYIVDENVDSVTITIIRPPAHGQLTPPNGPIVRYKSDSNFNGEDVILIQATDSNGLSAQGAITFNVSAANDLPVTTVVNKQLDEDTSVTIDVLASASDADGDPLSIVSVTAPANGTVTKVDGKLNYVPNQNFNGNDSFTYVISDGIGQVSSVVNIQVIARQDAPSATDDSVGVDEDDVVEINALQNDIDVDGDALTLVQVFDISGGTAEIINDGATIRFRPTANTTGEAQLSYQVSDKNNATDVGLVSIEVRPVPDSPQAVDDVIATDDNSPVTIRPLQNDIDVDGDVLTLVEITTAPVNGSAQIQANAIIYTPNANYSGSDVFTYLVTDPSGRTGEARITVNVTAVNKPPVAVPDVIESPEDVPVTHNVIANDTDPDNDTLQITNVSDTINGLITWDSTSITLVPNLNFTGVIEVTYDISDGNSTAQAAAAFTITPVQDAPVAQDDLASGLEDTPLSIPVLNNDTDADNDPLTIKAVGAPSFGTTSIEGSNIIYSPRHNYYGGDSFTYTISDGVVDVTATVQVTIEPVNDPPPDVPDLTITMPEDTTENDDISRTDILSGTVNPDADNLTLSIVQAPANGIALITPDSLLQYVPNANFNGADTVTVRISDGGPITQDVIVTINVTPLPDLPVANDDEFSIQEDPAEPFSLQVLNNDIDPDTGNNSSLVIVSASQPAGDHKVTLNPNNTLSFIPAVDESGVVSFTYKIVNGSGDATASVKVNITPVNDLPVGTADTATVQVGNSVAIPVLNNDTDAEGDVLTIASVTPPTAGTAVVNEAKTEIVYTPSVAGSYSFTYFVTDGIGEPVPTTVTVQVTAPPGGESNPPGEDGSSNSNDNEASENAQAPIADPMARTSNGEAISVNLAGAQVGLTASIDSTVAGGIATVEGSTITITPTLGYSGTFSVDYTLSNEIGTSSSSTLTVTVSAATAP